MTPYMMESLVLWGLVATTAMTAILQLSQGLGLSRMSLTFLMGSAFSGNRSVATVLGFVLYIIGGWLFAFLYFLFFTSIGIPGRSIAQGYFLFAMIGSRRVHLPVAIVSIGREGQQQGRAS